MTLIGPYELEHPLGSGGMAEVWKGVSTAMGGASKTIAVKLLASHLSDKPAYRDMFVDEARLSMLLSHSNIVQVFDVGEDQGRTYMAMEYVEGVNLSDLCSALWDKGETLPTLVSAYIVGEILGGLGYAHQLKHEGEIKTVVHRDISPQNVMISTSGEVKIMDFGIARFANQDTSGVHVKGKLRYMPPEQLRGESRRATIDLFAVGAILHELLNGFTFREDIVDESRLYGMILDGEYPPLAIDEAEIPAELNELRLGLLEADEGKRLASARDGLEILHRWAGFRNASLPLGKLVQQIIDERPDPKLVPTEPERLGSSTTRDRARAGHERTLRDTGLSQEHELADDVTAVGRKRRSPQDDDHGGSAWLPVTLIVLGLIVGVGSLAFGLGWFRSPEPEVVAQPTPAQPEPTTPAAQPEPEPEPEPEPAPVVEPEPAPVVEPEPAPVVEPEPAPEPVVETKPADDDRKKKQPVEVEFIANEFFYVEIKVANQVLTLEPVKKIKLAPGSYSLRLRKKADEPWTRAGRIKIEPGKAHRVAMLQPAGAKVTTP